MPGAESREAGAGNRDLGSGIWEPRRRAKQKLGIGCHPDQARQQTPSAGSASGWRGDIGGPAAGLPRGTGSSGGVRQKQPDQVVAVSAACRACPTKEPGRAPTASRLGVTLCSANDYCVPHDAPFLPRGRPLQRGAGSPAAQAPPPLIRDGFFYAAAIGGASPHR